MPNENTDQPITNLPTKVASGIAPTDYMLGIDSAEGYRMLIQDLGDYIIQHATSSLAGSNQTLANVISTLNSNINAKLVAYEIPQSNFTWFNENKRFSYENPVLGINNVIGFICRAANGDAIMSAYMNANSSRIDVFGWIPANSASISEDYQFKLYAIGYN